MKLAFDRACNFSQPKLNTDADLSDISWDVELESESSSGSGPNNSLELERRWLEKFGSLSSCSGPNSLDVETLVAVPCGSENASQSRNPTNNYSNSIITVRQDRTNQSTCYPSSFTKRSFWQQVTRLFRKGLFLRRLSPKKPFNGWMRLCLCRWPLWFFPFVLKRWHPKLRVANPWLAQCKISIWSMLYLPQEP